MTQGVILVVDDDPDSRDMLVAALVGADYTPVPARDGGEALDLLQTLTPDLVLLDAMMPVLDGFETCRRIKARADIAHLPVIFMTGLTDTEHVLAGLKAGGVDYVTKPVILDELLARMGVHLANARATHGARNALDTAGRRLIATDKAGDILWSTPLAGALLAEWAALMPLPDALGAVVRRLIAQAESSGHAADQPTQRIAWADREIEIALIGRTPLGEFLFRIAETTPGMEKRVYQDMFALTQREAEVLFWIARGKSNRDASDILNISPRTVNKHLEQIFVKLGVENRAAATAIATRLAAAQT